MYDRSAMQRTASYTYPQYAVAASAPSNKAYSSQHSNSSAFSASANPNEDWTKISDLAERRRIQNRIAQRNYRKKLKKRLEDLEKRAGSSSASPEQKARDPVPTDESSSSGIASRTGSPRHRASTGRIDRSGTPELLSQQYVLPGDDRGMFSQQYTRQLSTSPPPFSYGSLSGPDHVSFATYPHSSAYCGPSTTGLDMPLYPPYTAGTHYGATPAQPTKQEYYGDDEMNPFVSAYASMAGVDVSHSYQEAAPAYTPPLLDSIEYCSPDRSPSESMAYPLTPEPSIRQTPPMVLYGH